MVGPQTPHFRLMSSAMDHARTSDQIETVEAPKNLFCNRLKLSSCSQFALLLLLVASLILHVPQQGATQDAHGDSGRSSVASQCVGLPKSVIKPTVAVLGSGSFGKGLAVSLVRAQYSVVLGSRNPDAEAVKTFLEGLQQEVCTSCVPPTSSSLREAVQQADVVLIAIPQWTSDAEAVERISPFADALKGKIVIDTSNPFHVPGKGVVTLASQNIAKAGASGAVGLVHGSNHEPWSAGEALYRALLPIEGAKVVKGFNVIHAKFLHDPTLLGPGRHAIWLASNDAEAKQLSAELVCQMGFLPVDVGTIERSRNLEMMTELWVSMYSSDHKHFGFDYVARAI